MAQLLFQGVVRLGQVDAQLLQPARYADGPGRIAEVPLDLSHDGGQGERHELEPALRIEPVDGLDQADGADLQDVFPRCADVTDARGRVLDHAQVQLDQGVAHVRVLCGPLVQFVQPPEERDRQVVGVSGAHGPRIADRARVLRSVLLWRGAGLDTESGRHVASSGSSPQAPYPLPEG